MRFRRRHFPLTVLLLLPLCLMLLGCPKKTPPPETTKPSVTTKTQPTAKGSSGAGEETFGARREEDGQRSQVAALKGEDIPLTQPPRKEFVEPTPAEKSLFKNVYFDYDKSDIKPEYRSILEGIARWLKNNPGRQLLIEGHCDERGTNEYNLALGERRALSVRRYIVGLGILPDLLHTISYGEEKPVDPGNDESAWWKNRRAEFKLSQPE